jgi:hypothetical protein
MSDRFSDAAALKLAPTSSNIEDVLHSAAYSGLQKPADGFLQLFSSQNEHHIHIIDKPKPARGSEESGWQMVGGAIGTCAELGAFSLLMLGGEYALKSGALNTTPNGLIGRAVLYAAINGGVFSPSTMPDHFVADRLQHSVFSAAGTLIAFGGVAKAIEFAALKPAYRTYSGQILANLKLPPKI